MEGSQNSLQDWPRPYFRPGGGNPYLAYAVFGDIDPSPTLSRAKYRSNGLADGLAMSAYDRERHSAVFQSLLDDRLLSKCLDEDAPLAATVRAQNAVAILRGEIGDPGDLNYLRDTVGMLTYMLDHGGVAIFDIQAFKWWSPAAWRSQIFEAEKPVPGQHVVILVSHEGGGSWFHTRGMRTFGRPDISIRNVPPEGEAAIVDLCERFIGLQASGGIIPDGQEIHMAALPDGMRCRHRGSLDDPDFNNVHVEIVWPPHT